MHPTWDKWIGEEFTKDYFVDLAKRLEERERLGATIFPPEEQQLAVFDMDPFEVRVCILGQDPYIRPGQAHGFSFSVPQGVKTPPSLRNILKEIQSDIPQARIDLDVGSLDLWRKQGVLLLNNVLTVEEGKSDSHKGFGWETFTEEAIRSLSLNTEHVVFMLWGGNARKKAHLIDTSKHLVLESVHPSGLSAYRGFFGCKHFSQANAYLTSHGRAPIDWSNI